MRYLLLLFLSGFLFSSCKDVPEQDVTVKGKTFVAPPFSTERLTGMYAGEFRGSPIAIVLTHVSGKQASGYNVHNGINRKLSGVVEPAGGKLHLYLVEPGDSRFDGKFHLAIDTSNLKGEGTWESFVSKKEIPFKFRKRLIRKESDSQVFVDEMANYLTLKPDGSCSYSFLADTSVVAEPLSISGKYKKEKGKVIIAWKKNPLFLSGKSVFNLETERPIKGNSYEQQILRGESLVLSEIIM